MTIKNEANRDVDFPVSYDWTTSKSHTFKPRELSDVTKLMLANVFLTGDKSFQHMLRKCTTSWLVAITFGKDTVYLNLYDAEAVDDPKTKQISSSINKERAIIVEVSRDPETKAMVVNLVEPERANRAAHTGAFLYASRSLRPVEQQQIDHMTGAIDNSREARPVEQQELVTA